VKDPATGKRVSRANPESEWQRQDVPELRIVDEDVWQQVQMLRASRGGSRPHEKRRPQRLLSGLIYCGCCGAKYNVATRDYMRCSGRTNSGTCDASRLIKMSEVEERVLVSLERHLLTPDVISAALMAYREESERAQGQRASVLDKLQSELTDVERKLSRLLRLVEDGHADPAVAGPRLNELGQLKRELVGRLSVTTDVAPAPVVTDGGASYRTLVSNLRQELGEGREGTADAAALVRGLLHRIVVSPQADTNTQAIEVEAGFLPNRSPFDRYCTGGCGGVQPA